MKWLLITDKTDLENTIRESLISKDKKNKLVTSDFQSINIKNQIKDLDEIAGCLIFSEKYASNPDTEFDAIQRLKLANLSGILLSNDIPFMTNLDFLSEINMIDSDLFHIETEEKKFIEGISIKYEMISGISYKRISKHRLLNRGIPFTSDCFANYIAKNKEEIIDEFLSAGMGVNVRDDFGTPMLNIACRNDNYEIVELLLNLGAELNAVSEDRGYTAVMDAIWRGNEKITKYLISKGADLNTINKEGQTNLILAVGADRLNLVKILAENGADPDVKDMMGMSAYTYATLFRKEKIVEILKPYHKDL